MYAYLKHVYMYKHNTKVSRKAPITCATRRIQMCDIDHSYKNIQAILDH